MGHPTAFDLDHYHFIGRGEQHLAPSRNASLGTLPGHRYARPQATTTNHCRIDGHITSPDDGTLLIKDDWQRPRDDGTWYQSWQCFSPDSAVHPGDWSMPYYSADPSEYSSSSLSDPQSPPFTSPEVAIMPYSPPLGHLDALFYHAGMPQTDMECGFVGGQACVAMPNVQRYADAQPDQAAYEDEYYGLPLPQEGFLPLGDHLQDDRGYLPEEPAGQGAEPCDHDHSQTETAIPRRRQAPSNLSTIAQSTSRVNKRSRTTPTTSPTSRTKPAANRAFPCPLSPYGCTASFAAKNEWKRHTNTQHFRLGYWRCDQCSPTSNGGKGPNDFNRKDLFVQHVRRMHPPAMTSTSRKSEGPATKKARTSKAVEKDEAMEEVLNKTAERCYKVLRQAPTRSCCVICDECFEGAGSLDQRLEHIGRHMEEARKDGKEFSPAGTWMLDRETEKWLLEHGVLVKAGRKLVLA